jgi:predicted molibdopterin-dependent oxidoreductase YjgC
LTSPSPGASTDATGDVLSIASRKEVNVKRSYARLTRPLVRDDGSLREASLPEAVDRIATGLAAHHGDEFGLFSCSKGTNEMNYVAQKFSRVVMGSNNIDSCNRT